MYAVVVRERGQADQINTSGQHVQANVLPRARQAPGDRPTVSTTLPPKA
jgi:hypothetical protein